MSNCCCCDPCEICGSQVTSKEHNDETGTVECHFVDPCGQSMAIVFFPDGDIKTVCLDLCKQATPPNPGTGSTMTAQHESQLAAIGCDSTFVAELKKATAGRTFINWPKLIQDIGVLIAAPDLASKLKALMAIIADLKG